MGSRVRVRVAGVASSMTDHVSDSAEWQAVQGQAGKFYAVHLRDLFDSEPRRGERLAAQVADLYVDYSKNLVTDEVMSSLIALAERARLRERTAAMFAGEHINVTEDRAVLHTALRLPRDATLVVDGQDVVADVHEVLDRMAAFSDKVRSGEWKGATGERIRTVVNIGIGGSDLGPVMAYEALKAYADPAIECRFV